MKAIDGLFAPVTTLLIEAAMNKVPIVMVDLPEDQANSDHHYISSNRVQYQEMRNLLQPYICRDDDHFPSALRYIVECSREPKTVLTQLSQNVSYIVGNEENSYADILLRTIEEFR